MSVCEIQWPGKSSLLGANSERRPEIAFTSGWNITNNSKRRRFRWIPCAWKHFSICKFVCLASSSRGLAGAKKVWSRSVFSWEQDFKQFPEICLFPIFLWSTDLHWTNICPVCGSSVDGKVVTGVWVDTVARAKWDSTWTKVDCKAQGGSIVHYKEKR